MMHLILDSMWLDPHTLLWPFLGVTFEQGLPDDRNFIVVLLGSLNQIGYLVSEIVGFLIVCAFGFWLIKRRSVIRFLRSGKYGTSKNVAETIPHKPEV